MYVSVISFVKYAYIGLIWKSQRFKVRVGKLAIETFLFHIWKWQGEREFEVGNWPEYRRDKIHTCVLMARGGLCVRPPRQVTGGHFSQG